MTADSLPSQIAARLGVEPQPAVDTHIVSDLIGEAQRLALARRDEEHPLRLDLETVERAFGRQILDERVRSSVEAARERTLKLGAAAGSSSWVLMTFAADLFVSLAVERPWRSHDSETLVRALGRVIVCSSEEIKLHLLTAALRAPQLLELPPTVAIDTQLSMLLALSPCAEASMWVRDEHGRAECLMAVGETATTRRFRTTALRTLEGRTDESARGLIIGVAIRRWQAPWGALVARVRTTDGAAASLEETASAISPIAERDFLLHRSSEREHSLVKASERRLSRLGFDLHDGALQHIGALTRDVRGLRNQVQPAAIADVAAIESQLAELDRVLRELAHSLEPASLLRRPLERVIEAEVDGLVERSGIDARSRIVGDFGAMTHSQKIALIRVVQEALTNIREHSNARTVDVRLTASRSCVDLQIEDDGDGFEVGRTLQNAAQRGRLGLVGSSERVRLLGGSFDIRSKPGGPTTVSLTLPRWQPLAGEQPSLQLAY